jgi:catechol 2,3-dioxygenase-like lactoylglutathione lyase family enzyme
MTVAIDHMRLSVGDFDRARAFYAAALKPFGGTVAMELPTEDGGRAVGFGSDGKPVLWITSGGRVPHMHIALHAENREQVDAFYAAAMGAGGTDNGAPGVRPHYHANYYAAFVLDPEGHNIEAVIHTPPKAARAARRGTKRAAAARKPAKRAAAKPSGRAAKTGRRAAKPARKTAGKTARRGGRKTRR